MEADTVAFAKSLHLASPAERVSLIRAGVPASRIPELAAALHVSRERLLGMLNLPDSSIRRKAHQSAVLSADLSERVIGLVSLIGQVAIMVEDSGGPKDFDGAGWVGEWLERPIPALGGNAPADYMDTSTGQALVVSLLMQSQAGVFG